MPVKMTRYTVGAFNKKNIIGGAKYNSILIKLNSITADISFIHIFSSKRS
jgi:hypothetical protein